jgi:hypothetical protein
MKMEKFLITYKIESSQGGLDREMKEWRQNKMWNTNEKKNDRRIKHDWMKTGNDWSTQVVLLRL